MNRESVYKLMYKSLEPKIRSYIESNVLEELLKEMELIKDGNAVFEFIEFLKKLNIEVKFSNKTSELYKNYMQAALVANNAEHINNIMNDSVKINRITTIDDSFLKSYREEE